MCRPVDRLDDDAARRREHRVPALHRGHEGGAGNPPGARDFGTAYLWREVWARDPWLDILDRFAAVELETKKDPSAGKLKRVEKLLFSRWHQLDAVRRLEAAIRAEGPGQSYLVQHSAGSGKTNTIAWAAVRLAKLFGPDNRPVFD